MSNFEFRQEYVVYKTKKEGIYPIKETDWGRLKRQVGSMKPNKNWYQILSSISFGIFASSIFSLVGFATAENVKGWVLTATWSTLLVTLIAGVLLFVFDIQQKRATELGTKFVIQEMEEIEKSFEREEDYRN